MRVIFFGLGIYADSRPATLLLSFTFVQKFLASIGSLHNCVARNFSIAACTSRCRWRSPRKYSIPRAT